MVISTVHIELDIGQIFQTDVWFPESICLKEWYVSEEVLLLPTIVVPSLLSVSALRCLLPLLKSRFPPLFPGTYFGYLIFFIAILWTFEINGKRVIKQSHIPCVLKIA